ncbi:hypothetical protein XO10_07070 [Marinitoga sp. 1135]|uniref:Uncharacterized protein n=1 Tax=Marinitoga piezophila (strain DSM 14283 / JCM 11233 / KA3) TaxID=443254 RepID=H2J3T9_MARPK|nr:MULTISPECIES: hypothetical protein [Marinitoga]AEX85831.1 hypothetical protein Marpi_1436 [Marinitoga piezophila KA3]APT76270.1 hypothetical protein LN42_07665 [Marinitoga sp. 1137]NUU96035.1 hypothetical protein [Marinitoga sp. 1135]NUU97947.1 hypothetical protein [Marinitoga sp. 1138]
MNDKIKVKVIYESDNQNFDREFSKEQFSNFNELVNFFQTEKLNSVLVGMKINGKDIPMKFYDELKGAYFEGGEEVELTFDDLYGLVKKLLLEGKEYIDKIEKSLENVSKEVMLNTEEGHKMLKALAEGLQAMNTIINQASNVLNKQFISDEDMEKQKEILEKIIESQSNADNVEISDILDYDFPQILDMFKDAFERAINEIE